MRAAEIEVGIVVEGVQVATAQITGLSAAINSAGVSGLASASRFSRLGFLIAGLGFTFAAAGKAGLAFYKGSLDAANEYNKTAALTFTQVDRVGVSLARVKDIGRDVARAIPAPFEQMQKSLFDIFSSMDVGASEAQKLLENFARAAVAGQTDVQTAGRASIAIMNAFKIPVSDVTRVMDIQFQAVRKGVFTYEEFASTIGRAIPSAVRAGQSIETLSGMMAFLTRNGLSAAMAATSAARGLDLIANPAFIKRMNALGLSVSDASGNFRPMLSIMTELRMKLADLPLVERAEVLKELTKGAGGTIQAMRFMNLAVADSNGLFGEMVGAMGRAGGAMGNAYDIMLSQPQIQLQLLKNRWAVLRTEIGDMLVPALVKLVTFGNRVLNWFQNLNPGLKRAITFTGLFLSILALVGGTILIIIGGFLALAAALTLMGVTTGGVALAIGGLLAALLLLPVVIFLLVRHWDTLKEVVTNAWDSIKGTVGEAVESIKSFITGGIDAIQRGWDASWSKVAMTIERVKGAIMGPLNEVRAFLSNLWSTIYDDVERIWGWVLRNTEGMWGQVSEAISHVVNVVMGIVRFLVRAFTVIWDLWGDDILRTIKTVWGIISGVIGGVVKVIIGIVKLFLAIINGEWGKAWEALKNILAGVWDAIFAIIKGAFELLKRIFGIVLSPIRQIWDKFWETLVQPVINALTNAWSFVKASFEFIRDIISGVLGAIWERIKTVWEGLMVVLGPILLGLKTLVEFVFRVISVVIAVALGIIFTIWKVVWNAIVAFITPIWNGLKWLAENVFGPIRDFIVGVWETVSGAIKTAWEAISGWISKKWEEFKTQSIERWELIKGIFTGVWTAIRETIVGIWESVSSWIMGKFNAVRDFIAGVWTAIKDKITGPMNDVKKGVTDAVSGIKTFWDTTWDAIKTKAETVWTAIVAAVKGAVNPIIGAINKLIGVAESFINAMIKPYNDIAGKLGIGTVRAVKFSRIPEMAEGGIVMKPTLALIGERKPEVVEPLDEWRRRGQGVNIEAGAVQVNINGVEAGVDISKLSRLVGEEVDEALVSLVRELKG